MRIVKLLFTPVLMGVLFVLFALSMAVATFIENDFGSAAAYNIVYDSIWFEMILLLLAVNMIGQVIQLKLYKKGKLTVFMFHLAFLIILTGAAITRFFGYEGSIHIREGDSENRLYSSNKYIGYTVKDPQGNIVTEYSRRYYMTSITADNFKSKLTVDDNEYELTLSRIIPNAAESLSDSPDGEPVVSFMITTGSMEMNNIIIQKGDVKYADDYSIGFDVPEKTDLKLTSDTSGFYISSDMELSESGMMHGTGSIQPAGTLIKLIAMQIIGIGNVRLIPQQMSLNGSVKAVRVNPDEQDTGQNAFVFHLFGSDNPQAVTLWERRGDNYATGSMEVNGSIVDVFYGSKVSEMPFSIKLNDFILERYPGSNSPSGYKSDVLLVDKAAGIEEPHEIFMNNILKYKGYRFYQSSFDPDEKGTILSVSHDRAGMMVTYTGYALLVLFIILSIANRNSVYRKVNSGYWSSPFKKAVTLVAIMLMFSGLNMANGQRFEPDRKAAEEFGKVLVQDQKGRTKPLFTLSNDILRKVARVNDFEGLSSMQVYLGIFMDFDHWQDEPLIKVSDKSLQKQLGLLGNKAAFSDIVNLSGNGEYKLSADVQKAYAKAPGERTKTDKEIMKVDERVNIVYMVYSGQFLRLFPLKDTTGSWGSADMALNNAISREDSLYLNNIIPLLAESLQNDDIAGVKRITGSITEYQKRFAGYELPSDTEVRAELFYYKAKIFERLFPFYFTFGLILLVLLIARVISGRSTESVLIRIASWLIFVGFIFHTLGLALRWYIAGHAPMSNGYESMIFISWVTLLAGIIFGRKSLFTLPATSVLGAMTLMVAHLSFMDPEITNLVPVLKSYWLTLHVSVITGSYGFLGLGAILGLINLILLSLSTTKNGARVGRTIEELTIINYKTLTLGLYFLTIGTFLGAVWANESWGRYWGWDPKETWSLITVIIYSLVIHSKMIPGLKDIYSFNVLSLFAFSSVLMTYFGVNFYLSGLHSYASGDPVPVPSFVYIAVIVLASVALIAYQKYNKWKKMAEVKG